MQYNEQKNGRYFKHPLLGSTVLYQEREADGGRWDWSTIISWTVHQHCVNGRNSFNFDFDGLLEEGSYEKR